MADVDRVRIALKDPKLFKISQVASSSAALFGMKNKMEPDLFEFLLLSAYLPNRRSPTA